MESAPIRQENSKLWGDVFFPGKDVENNDWFRVWSHNVNGLSARNNSTDLQDFANTMRDKGVSICGIQETNRNFEKKRLVQSFHVNLRSVSKHYRGAVSSAQIQWPSDYQPGGTAVFVRNKWATRFLAQGDDKLGRWSWITLTGKGTTKVVFVSVYRVCDGSSGSSITSRTVRAQQEWWYAERGNSKVNLREQCMANLQRMIVTFQKEGCDVVLMMDANKGSELGSGVDKLIQNCGLADAHADSGGLESPPATYQRGSKKIDFILVSPRLVRMIVAACILPINKGYIDKL
jgi:exonuclease III